MKRQERSEMEERKALIDQLTHKLLETEKNIARIRAAMKTTMSSKRLRTLVNELRTVIDKKDALESQLTQLHSPTQLFYAL
jgi:predicted  nucleic acid-binding Zn-ribbon protein